MTAPFFVFNIFPGGGFLFFDLFRQFDKLFRGFRKFIQDYVFDRFQQLRFYVVVNLQHGRIYNPHIQSGVDGVV